MTDLSTTLEYFRLRVESLKVSANLSMRKPPKPLSTELKLFKKRIKYVKSKLAKKTIIYLGGNLGSIEIEEGSRKQLLSQGDDGFVVKSTQDDEPKTYIIKVYKAKLRENEYNKNQEVRDELKKFVQDQALREFTCL